MQEQQIASLHAGGGGAVSYDDGALELYQYDPEVSALKIEPMQARELLLSMLVEIFGTKTML